MWLSTGRQEMAIHDAGGDASHNPFREASVHQLMEGHQLNGGPAKALQAYEEYRSLLTEELGTSPSSETEPLYVEVLRES